MKRIQYTKYLPKKKSIPRINIITLIENYLDVMPKLKTLHLYKYQADVLKKRGNHITALLKRKNVPINIVTIPTGYSRGRKWGALNVFRK